MPLCLYAQDDPGYTPLNMDALTNEQAIAIGDMVHRVALEYSELTQLIPMSFAVKKALSYCHPPVVTVRDLRTKPLESWRQHRFITHHIYHELREDVRSLGVRLPAWEMLP